MDMPDYKEMYLTLFRETTKAIAILQAVQQRTEEIYIAEDIDENIAKKLTTIKPILNQDKDDNEELSSQS